MRSAIGCAALGLLLLLVAGTFDAEPLYVTGSALVLLGLGAAGWIGLGARGARVQRSISRRSVVEEEPLQVEIDAFAGRLPLPPGWIDEPLLPEPVRFNAGRRSARVRVEVTFGRRGRRMLPPPALVLRDPFGLAQRVVTGGEPDELLVLPRIFPVTATAGGEDSEHAHARATTARAEPYRLGQQRLVDPAGRERELPARRLDPDRERLLLDDAALVDPALDLRAPRADADPDRGARAEQHERGAGDVERLGVERAGDDQQQQAQRRAADRGAH